MTNGVVFDLKKIKSIGKRYYNPARYRGGILQLHYAGTPELGPWLDLVAVRGEVVVQFWLKPGDRAVMLEKGEEREVVWIPEQLRRFL